MAGDSSADEHIEQTLTELKRISDNHLEVEREFEKEVHALRLEARKRQQSILDCRASILKDSDTNEPSKSSQRGTPACEAFWLEACNNHHILQDEIQKWDASVLEYLTDISAAFIDDANCNGGFKVLFHFSPNPYFENAELSIEVHTQPSPITPDCEVSEIKGSTIKWKAGKNVMVESTQKKRGGKSVEEQRDSFFELFCSLRAEGPLPRSIDIQRLDLKLGDGSDLNEAKLTKAFVDHIHEVALAVFEDIVPYAIRWFTGEAAAESDDDDDASSISSEDFN